MAEKTMNTRMQQKSDIAAHWALAVNFVPKAGEIIVYSDLGLIKVGDGTTTVSNLPFLNNSSNYFISSSTVYDTEDEEE